MIAPVVNGIAINCRKCGKPKEPTRPNSRLCRSCDYPDLTRVIGNGKLVLPLASGKFYTVWGGRTYDRPRQMAFLKLAEEIAAPCEIDVPVRDFSVPTIYQIDDGLHKAVEFILLGYPLYVGCMGGKGRTGLMLALIAKAFGVDDPIGYVRRNYFSHAVETEEQKKWVSMYRVPKHITKMIAGAELLSFVRKGKSLTRKTLKIPKNLAVLQELLERLSA